MFNEDGKGLNIKQSFHAYLDIGPSVIGVLLFKHRNELVVMHLFVKDKGYIQRIFRKLPSLWSCKGYLYSWAHLL